MAILSVFGRVACTFNSLQGDANIVRKLKRHDWMLENVLFYFTRKSATWKEHNILSENIVSVFASKHVTFAINLNHHQSPLITKRKLYLTPNSIHNESSTWVEI